MSEAKVLPAVEARVHLGEIMKRAFKKGERFIVEKSGIPMVAIVNANEFMRLIKEREERFRVLDKVRKKAPIVTSREVEEDIVRAKKATRKKNA